MKKFAKILTVVMLIAIVAMTFASCGLFSLDLGDVEDRLEDEDYTVYHYKKYDKADSYTKYMVEYIFEELDIDAEPVAVLGGYKNDDFFYAVELDGFFDAISAYESAKDNWDDFSEDADGELTFGKQGSVLYIGTVDAVKDALSFPANLFVFEK